MGSVGKNLASWLLTGCAVLLLSACGGSEEEDDSAPKLVRSVALNCPTGQVVTGIAVRSGDIIDRLSLRCSPLTGGSIDTFRTTEGEGVGGFGGDTVHAPFTCPTGQGVVGISGSNGFSSWRNVMSSVRVNCGLTESPTYNEGEGYLPFIYRCPLGKVATGFNVNLVTRNGYFYTGTVTAINCTNL
jgi:hypothetical protein